MPSPWIVENNGVRHTLIQLFDFTQILAFCKKAFRHVRPQPSYHVATGMRLRHTDIGHLNEIILREIDL